jgi:hypothetical protein
MVSSEALLAFKQTIVNARMIMWYWLMKACLEIRTSYFVREIFFPLRQAETSVCLTPSLFPYASCY